MFRRSQIYGETIPNKKKEVVKIRDSKIEIWMESSEFDFIEITIIKKNKFWFHTHLHSYTLVNSHIMDHRDQLSRIINSIRFILANYNIHDDIVDIKSETTLSDALHHALNKIKYKKKYLIK
jgi:hypothetical protein